MNAAVRAVVRMGFYLGCKTYYIKEVLYLSLLSDTGKICTWSLVLANNLF